MTQRTSTLGLLAALSMTAAPAAAQLFGPGDTFLAIDLDTGIFSNYPGAEGPGFVADQNATTKYLNFGKEGTGLIITPFFYGPSTVQSIQFTTANDAPERDPTSYELYGTNDAIASFDNSDGMGESWTLISSGTLDPSMDRFTPGAIHDFSNGTIYESYKIIFPTLRDSPCANSMQVADVSLYTGPGGSGDQVLQDGDPALAIGVFKSESNYPCAETPANAFDGDALTKYLNFGIQNTGVIMQRADGKATIVQSFSMTTANDFFERDPAVWELYGTNDALVSTDNSDGSGENWTFIDGGFLALPLDRLTQGDPVFVNNTEAYTAYRMVIVDVVAAAAVNSMQVAEITFEGEVVGGDTCAADLAPAPDGDGQVNTNDFFQFLSYYQTQDLGADFSPPGGDGNINTNDFFAFLAAYQDALTNGC